MKMDKTNAIWSGAMRALLIAVALSFLIPIHAQAYDLDAAVTCPGGACLSESSSGNIAVSPNGWPSGTYPNQVEPINRETLAGLQRFWNRINGNVTVGGSANAITITTSNSTYPTSYVTGEQICLKAAAANTSSVTVNLNGLGNVNLYRQGSSGATAMSGGEIQVSQLICMAYDGTEFQLLGSPANVVIGSGTATVAGVNVTGSSVPANGLYLPATNTSGISANNALVATFNGVASPANYVTLSASATGNAVGVGAQGSDTNINMAYLAKGIGSHDFFTGLGQQYLQFVIGNTTSSVNYFSVTGAATGGGPSLSATGSDTNIALNLFSKGTQSINLETGGGNQVAVINTASAVNLLQLTGNSTGNAPIISSSGSDTNVGLNYDAKGTGPHFFYTGGGSFYPQFEVTNTTSAVDYLTVTGAVTATNGNPQIAATGSDTNININLSPKGTGGVVIGTAATTPSHTATCTAGTMWWDTGFIYVCTVSGTVKRATLSAF